MVLLALFLKMVHQLLLVQAHEQVPVVTPQTLVAFVVQFQTFSMLIFNGMAFIIDILIEIPLISSFLDACIIIFCVFGSNKAKINENGCICNSNTEIIIANERKFSTYKTNYNYNNGNDIRYDLDPIAPIEVGIEGNSVKQLNWDSLLLQYLMYQTGTKGLIETVFRMWISIKNGYYCGKIHCAQKETSISTKMAHNIQFLLN